MIFLPLRSTQRTFSGILGGDKLGVRVTEGELTDLLASIEVEGWRLEHANHFFQDTGGLSGNEGDRTEEDDTPTGETWGAYIFRRRSQ
jgi:hypothetical protein